jgi:hypothetical protein
MRWLIALAAFAALGIAAGSASAGPPLPVSIVIHTNTVDGFGTFASTGGGLCSTGITTDVVDFSGYESGHHINFHVLKTFTCADGSGTFTIEMQAHYFFGAPTDAGAWVIASGTGAYTNLAGTGSVTGDEGDGSVVDHLSGSVH